MLPPAIVAIPETKSRKSAEIIPDDHKQVKFKGFTEDGIPGMKT